MYKRNIEARIREAMADTPVVFLNGARQTGKTTLVHSIVHALGGATYVTLDDAAVTHDPTGFIGRLDGPVVLDEVQKAPDLFPAIKVSVDRDRRPGRFLLTGSADVMMLPTVSESLAGRMEILTLCPVYRCAGCPIRRSPDSRSPMARPALVSNLRSQGAPLLCVSEWGARKRAPSSGRR